MINILTTGRTEPCKGVGGIKTVYLFPYTEYSYTQIVGNRGKDVTSFPATDIYEFETNDAIMTETGRHNEDGLIYEQSLTFSLKKQGFLSTRDLDIIKGIELRYIVKFNNGDFKIGGLWTGAMMTYEMESGSGKETFNGYRLTINSQEEWAAAFIDSLSGAGFTISEVLLLEDFDELLQEDLYQIILE